MQLDVTDDIEGLNEQLISIYARLNGDLSELMDNLGTIALRSTEDRLKETKQAPDGTDWASLMPSTVAQKGHSQILHRLGTLEDSIVMRVSEDSVIVGTSVEYGKYHQTGTPQMVARPFLGISESDKTNMLDVLNEFMKERVYG